MVTRRNFLAAAGFASLSLGIAGCSNASERASSGGSSGKGVNLDVMWWGDDSVARATNAVLELYGKKYAPNTAKGQGLAWDNYFNKLSTLAAAKSLPDVMTFNGDNLSAYANNGLLLDLGAGTSVDLGDYRKEALGTGQYKGKLYGVNFGYEFVTIMYSTQLMEKSGMTPPADPSDWTAWGNFSEELAKKLGGGIYGIRDCTGDANVLLSFLISRGKEGIWAASGAMGYDEEDARAWFGYWDDLRNRGAVSPGPQTLAASSSGGGASSDPLTTGKAVLSMTTVTGFEGYQAVNKVPLGLAACPTGPARRGEWSSFYGFAVSAASKNPDAAKDLLHVWFTDPEAWAAIGFTHGIPASPKQLELLGQDAKGAAKSVLDFMKDHTIEPVSIPASPARLGSKFDAVFAQASESLLSGSATLDDAVARFMRDSKKAFEGA